MSQEEHVGNSGPVRAGLLPPLTMSLLYKGLRIHQVFGANTDVGKTVRWLLAGPEKLLLTTVLSADHNFCACARIRVSRKGCALPEACQHRSYGRCR
jgi:hypothetical protein